MSEFEFILVEDVAPAVRRITLNRPEKRNALNNGLRGEIFALGFHTHSTREYFKEFPKGVKHALNARDSQFGDYRTENTHDQKGDE